MNVAKDVNFEPGSAAGEGDIHNNLYLALLVLGKDDELIDAVGLAWSLPSSIYDTPLRSKIWAKYCIDVAKVIVVNSKPRHAITDATLMVEFTLLTLGESDLCALDAFRGRRIR